MHDSPESRTEELGFGRLAELGRWLPNFGNVRAPPLAYNLTARAIPTVAVAETIACNRDTNERSGQ
jgi:hypothetical protein